MPSKNANQILDKAVVRCKKAQSLARPFNNKKKIKAGATVQQKMAELIEMTNENDFGKLTTELQTLDDMIAKMQIGVLEGLLESVETIERRMKSYQKSVLKAELNSLKVELDESTSAYPDDEDDTQRLLDETECTMTSEHPSAYPDDEDDTQHLLDETEGTMNSEHPRDDTSHSPEKADDWNDTDHDVGMEITTLLQQRFMDRLRNFFSFQRIAEERVATIDPQGKVRCK